MATDTPSFEKYDINRSIGSLPILASPSIVSGLIKAGYKASLSFGYRSQLVQDSMSQRDIVSSWHSTNRAEWMHCLPQVGACLSSQIHIVNGQGDCMEVIYLGEKWYEERAERTFPGSLRTVHTHDDGPRLLCLETLEPLEYR